jgi:hypothetical protein
MRSVFAVRTTDYATVILVGACIGIASTGCTDVRKNTEAVEKSTEAVSGNMTTLQRTTDESLRGIRANTEAIAKSTETVQWNNEHISESNDALWNNTRQVEQNGLDVRENTACINDNTSMIQQNTSEVNHSSRSIADNTSAIRLSSDEVSHNTVQVLESARELGALNKTLQAFKESKFEEVINELRFSLILAFIAFAYVVVAVSNDARVRCEELLQNLGANATPAQRIALEHSANDFLNSYRWFFRIAFTICGFLALFWVRGHGGAWYIAYIMGIIVAMWIAGVFYTRESKGVEQMADGKLRFPGGSSGPTIAVVKLVLSRKCAKLQQPVVRSRFPSDSLSPSNASTLATETVLPLVAPAAHDHVTDSTGCLATAGSASHGVEGNGQPADSPR